MTFAMIPRMWTCNAVVCCCVLLRINDVTRVEDYWTAHRSTVPAGVGRVVCTWLLGAFHSCVLLECRVVECKLF